jgi:hypothetical protein
MLKVGGSSKWHFPATVTRNFVYTFYSLSPDYLGNSFNP